jgi:hypothetical protein
MIRPVNFMFNAQTAVNNAFQIAGNGENTQEKAQQEFDNLVETLKEKGIDVTVINDTPEPHTPDSIFPNNWISFHENGSIVLYPMFAKNRRLERKPNILDLITRKFSIHKTIDLSFYENQHKYLEGTGSMVLDRDNRIAYACLSPRTDKELLLKFCEKMNYSAVPFHANDQNGSAIYHTNVMMCVADRFVVICLKSIHDKKEREEIIDTINRFSKEIIEIDLDQMNRFAGNMLQVQNQRGKKFIVMSSRTYGSLDKSQIALLEKYNEIIHSPLDAIEKNGGGSARCMIAEVFL